MNHSIDILLFDLGNVLLDWQPIRLYEQVFEGRAEAQWFLDHICTMEWHSDTDRGVPFAKKIAELIVEHPRFAKEIGYWDTRWMDMFDGYVPGMEALFSELVTSRCKLFALTNMSHEKWPDHIRAFPLLKYFEDVVISSEEGVIKPDSVIFERTLKRLGSPAPETVLFIDDSQKNIEAARKLGFQTHHFKVATALKEDLSQRGLI